MAEYKGKPGGGDQQQQQERRPKPIACSKALEIAADKGASVEALLSLGNHLAFPLEGCTCTPTILEGYRTYLAAAKTAGAEAPKPKDEGAKQEPAKQEQKKETEGGFFQKLDKAGKKLFG